MSKLRHQNIHFRRLVAFRYHSSDHLLVVAIILILHSLDL
jgi:hypothetical protein